MTLPSHLPSRDIRRHAGVYADAIVNEMRRLADETGLEPMHFLAARMLTDARVAAARIGQQQEDLSRLELENRAAMTLGLYLAAIALLEPVESRSVFQRQRRKGTARP